MGEILTDILLAILFIVLIAVIILFTLSLYDGLNNYAYSYADLNGDKGVAKRCVINRGGLICQTEDGKIIQVSDFQKFRKEKEEK